MFNLKYKNKPGSAWGSYWKKKQEIHEKSANELQTIIENADDPNKTPVPCPRKAEALRLLEKERLDLVTAWRRKKFRSNFAP